MIFVLLFLLLTIITVKVFNVALPASVAMFEFIYWPIIVLIIFSLIKDMLIKLPDHMHRPPYQCAEGDIYCYQASISDKRYMYDLIIGIVIKFLIIVFAFL